MDIGEGAYKIRVKFQNIPKDKMNGQLHDVQINVNLDDKWEQILETQDCQVKDKLANVIVNLWVPMNGEFSEWKKGTLNQHVKRHVWFWTLSDCKNNIKNLPFSGIKVVIEIKILNADESHFSIEEQGQIILYGLLTFLSFGFMFYNCQKYVQFYQREQVQDWALLIILIALGLSFIQYLMQFIHLIIYGKINLFPYRAVNILKQFIFPYSKNGYGLTVLNLFSQLAGVGSEVTITMLFILISWGWTILYSELDDVEVYIPLAILVGVLQMVVIGLGKLTDDSHSKYHQYDGWAGIVVFMIRVGFYIYYMIMLKDTFTKARQKVKDFVRSLQVFGTVYFLAFPLIVIISYIFAPYVRLKIVTLGTLALQTAIIVILSFTCNSKSSSYYSVSLKSKPLLPSDKFD